MNSIKTVLVTGANRGIGLETCRQLAEKGFKVFLTARNVQAGKKAVDKLKRNGHDIHFIELDVSKEESINKAAQKFSYFNVELNVLVNNAAILIDDVTIFNTNTELFINSLTTNSFGPANVINSFLRFMNKGSRIINVSSGAGSVSNMSSYAPLYSVSKAALNAITKQFASVLAGKKIAVNSVDPGWVKTDMGSPCAPRSLNKGTETIVWLAAEAPIGLTGKFLKDKMEVKW
jgi:NAD(P)-dependent dehydrogenase (short-subunit alcohol dehydrogenase family)